MARTYAGLAMSSTMFQGDCLISRKVLSADEAKQKLSGEVVSCFNPSHIATIEALGTRFDIEVEIPETAPKVILEPGDSLLVLSARFTRRLSEGERFSSEEVNSASFEFVEYRIYPRAWHGIVSISEEGLVTQAEHNEVLGYVS